MGSTTNERDHLTRHLSTDKDKVYSVLISPKKLFRGLRRRRGI